MRLRKASKKGVDLAVRETEFAQRVDRVQKFVQVRFGKIKLIGDVWGL